MGPERLCEMRPSQSGLMEPFTPNLQDLFWVVVSLKNRSQMFPFINLLLKMHYENLFKQCAHTVKWNPVLFLVLQNLRCLSLSFFKKVTSINIVAVDDI